MTKEETIVAANNGEGCLGKAHAKEPVFVLRAQDKFAPDVIEVWATMVARGAAGGVGFETQKVKKARALAHTMRAWQELNSSKVPD